MPAMRGFKSIGVWVLILAAALAVLIGRYDWAPAVTTYSWRAWISSAYLLVLTLPALYYLLLNLGITDRRSTLCTALAGVVLVLPYKWLGLSQLYYHRDRPPFFPVDPKNMPTWDGHWLPKIVPTSPGEGLLFGLLVLAGIVVAAICWRTKSHRNILFWLGVFIFILFQTWLHSGPRSPYLYITTYERPSAENYHYAWYLSENGLSPVNGDYPVFRELEEYYMGWPRGDAVFLNGMLMRRSYEGYLSSQLSYFVNPIYVYIVINVTLWFLATLAAYAFARPHWGGRVAAIFAVLVGSGSGFIMYAAQPANYAAAFALTIIVLYLYERLSDAGRFVLFGLILGLASMVYDMFPLYLVLILYAWYRGSSVLGVIGSCALSFGLYQGFMYLQQGILHLELSDANSTYMTNSLNNIISLFSTQQYAVLYERACHMLGMYINNLMYAFFAVPVLLALLGLLFNSNPAGARRAVIFAAGAFAITCYFVLGGIDLLSSMPRFVYIAYPCVYLLAAAFIDHASLRVQNRWPVMHSAGVASMLLAPVIVLNNFDVFGFPQLYYWFYCVRPGYWK